jgi:hypothetical protein
MSNRPRESSSPNLEQLLQMGIRAAREENNKEGARVFFERVLEQNPEEERAWIWMAWAAETDVDRRRYLETAIRINPRSKARQMLTDMESMKSSGENRTLVRGLSILGILIALVILVIIVAIILSRPG